MKLNVINKQEAISLASSQQSKQINQMCVTCCFLKQKTNSKSNTQLLRFASRMVSCNCFWDVWCRKHKYALGHQLKACSLLGTCEDKGKPDAIH